MSVRVWGLMVTLGLLGARAPVLAEEARMDGHGHEIAVLQGVPSPESVRDGLFPEDKCVPVEAAGIKCSGVVPSLVFSLPAAAFARGSAIIPPGLKAQLDVFAEVLGSKRGSSQTVRVVGHADATGTESGNLVLSERRARQVVAYLVGKGADPKMLQASGVGSKELLNTSDPTSAENRRVSISR